MRSSSACRRACSGTGPSRPIDILLTGASGFVGRHLREVLAPRHRVISLNHSGTGQVGEIVADLHQPLPVRSLPARIDAVIHAAAIVGARADKGELDRVNVEATRELARWAAQAGARQFVFCSTGGVYRPDAAPLSENSPTGPADGYGRSKLDAERALAMSPGLFARQVLRLFFPYGRGQSASRLMPRLAERIRAGQPVQARAEDGGPLLTPLHVSDLVAAIVRLVGDAREVTANLCGKEAISIRELATRIGAIVGVAPIFEAPDSPQAGNWIGAGTRFASTFGWRPRVSLEEGLRLAFAPEISDEGAHDDFENYVDEYREPGE